MPLSWNEIRNRATNFAREWSGAERERAEAQTFWNEFFQVFGIRRRTVASFEEPVHNLGGAYDFIDLFWSKRLIAEHKTRGRDLAKAHTQAMGYIQSLHNDGRGDEVPRYILVSDFARFALHDLEPEEGRPETVEFRLEDFPEQIRHFAFIAGYETRRLNPEDPANMDATQLLANLHDRLEDGGYGGHHLERFMVRILFCLFAEDTRIFEPEAFTNFVVHHTRADGADTGAQLSRMFEVLNTPKDQRQRNLDEDLAAMEYVNGDLFAERLNFADFSAAMRTALLACCNFRWEKISPAVFGSLFQNIMKDRQRRQIGAHYTSERDIMKLIRSLFLDELRERFENIRRDRQALARFHRDLGEMRFLDPACGCGNFLVIAYRELRRLELDIIQARFGNEPTEADIRAESRLNVGQFYGIEIEEWPVRIAEVAMWLMDHQMNAEIFARFGQVKATTPLTRSPHIVQANALQIDWNEVLPAAECTYVLGNPPFVGKKEQNADQKTDMELVWQGMRGTGVLDYVTCWYKTALKYVEDRDTIAIAFVSTNSITQGEQVGILWPNLFRTRVKIMFAHRTFEWMSEARGRAHVHVVIIGLRIGYTQARLLHDYEPDPDHPTVSRAANISPYLVEGSDTAVLPVRRPICDVPDMVYGSFALDDGNYTLSPEDRDTILAEEPGAAPFIRAFIGGRELLHNEARYCLWLQGADPAVIRALPAVMRRIDAVRRWRGGRGRTTTRELANVPTQFAEIRQPDSPYLAIPTLSSVRRPYIPIALLRPETIASNQLYILPNATLWHLGILHSIMHFAWIRQVGGRFKSDYRYSNAIVYNNYPWPQATTDAQRQRVEQCAQAVLDARTQFPDSTLADLYDPNVMPPALRHAHDALDRAVDRCYRTQAFTSERQRLEFLFNLYEQLIAPLTAAPRRRARNRGRGGIAHEE
jgi:hypothetical protein